MKHERPTNVRPFDEKYIYIYISLDRFSRLRHVPKYHPSIPGGIYKWLTVMIRQLYMSSGASMELALP